MFYKVLVVLIYEKQRIFQVKNWVTTTTKKFSKKPKAVLNQKLLCRTETIQLSFI